MPQKNVTYVAFDNVIGTVSVQTGRFGSIVGSWRPPDPEHVFFGLEAVTRRLAYTR